MIVNIDYTPLEIIQSNPKRDNNVSDKEQSIIIALLKRVNPQTILEIGTYRGDTTHLLSQHFPQSDIYTIGLTQKYVREEKTPLEKKWLRGGTTLTEEENGKSCEEDSNVTIIVGDSRDQKVWDDIPQAIDAVFVDGNHYYDYVLTDTIKAYTKEPSLIIWHDYRDPSKVEGFYRENVTQAVLDLSSLLSPIYYVWGTKLAFWGKENMDVSSIIDNKRRS